LREEVDAVGRGVLSTKSIGGSLMKLINKAEVNQEIEEKQEVEVDPKQDSTRPEPGPEPAEPQCFAQLPLTIEETVTIYAAMQLYHQNMAAKDELDMSERIVGLMKRLRPSAVQAAQVIRGGAVG
jgi:hypothetical protein